MAPRKPPKAPKVNTGKPGRPAGGRNTNSGVGSRKAAAL